MQNISHWYDGIIYETFIDPFQSKLFSKIKKIISKDSTLLDIACGTGRFAFELSNHCKHITGIDLSIKNINRAKIKGAKYKNTNFIHENAINIEKIFNYKFDYATINLALHEMPPSIRLNVISSIKSVTDTIIFSDYQSPMRKDLTGLGVELIEFIAGSNHYAGYKHYQSNGGLELLIKESDLKIVETLYSHNNTLVIYKTVKNG